MPQLFCVCKSIFAATKKRAEMRQPTSMTDLEKHFDCLKGCVMMGFPMGLPKYDVITSIIENCENLESLPVT